MKTFFTWIVAIGIPMIMFGQAPDKISYQAILRDPTNALVINQTVGMQLSILHGSASGNAVYIETHNPTTNVNGLVSVEIGTGTAVTGAFNDITWSDGPYFIKTETDITGGTSYTVTGISELLSVPYALHANTSSSCAPSDKLTLIPTHFGGNTTSSTTGSSGVAFIKFNKNNYAGVDSITFISTPYVGDPMNHSIAQLINYSEDVDIEMASVSSNQTSPYNEDSFFETNDISEFLPDYEITLGIRVTSQIDGMFAGIGTSLSFLAIYRE